MSIIVQLHRAGHTNISNAKIKQAVMKVLILELGRVQNGGRYCRFLAAFLHQRLL